MIKVVFVDHYEGVTPKAFDDACMVVSIRQRYSDSPIFDILKDIYGEQCTLTGKELSDLICEYTKLYSA